MHSPLVVSTLCIKHDMSPEIEGLAKTLLLGVPIAIPVGCRLILSIREAASLHHLCPISGHIISTFVAQDGSRREEDSRSV